MASLPQQSVSPSSFILAVCWTRRISPSVTTTHRAGETAKTHLPSPFRYRRCGVRVCHHGWRMTRTIFVGTNANCGGPLNCRGTVFLEVMEYFVVWSGVALIFGAVLMCLSIYNYVNDIRGEISELLPAGDFFFSQFL